MTTVHKGRAAALPIPEARYWDLSPTWSHWTKLSAWDIAVTLRTEPQFAGQNVLFYNNCPVRFVYLVGVVVSVDIFSPTLVFIVIDDSSGACIEVAVKEETQIPGLVWTKVAYATDTEAAYRPTGDLSLDDRRIAPGDVLRIKGEIHTLRRGLRQVNLRRVARVADTKSEVEAWKDRAAVRKVLEGGWKLTDAKRAKFDEEEARKQQQKADDAETRRRRKVEHERNKEQRRLKREQLRREEAQRMDEGALI